METREIFLDKLNYTKKYALKQVKNENKLLFFEKFHRVQ